MKIAGIIAEYNPFHNGHALHIAMTRRNTGCSHPVAAMSGHFVQRGEAAIFDKWSRAEMAVRGGADLIIELPCIFSVRSAQYFATGGVRLLAALGATYLSFGAEQADLTELGKAAYAVDDPLFGQIFTRHITEGVTYAKALAATISEQTGLTEQLVGAPNNILAIEYLRAIKKWAPAIAPVAIPRMEAEYHDPVIQGTIASATAIRLAMITEIRLSEKIRQAVPFATYEKVAQLLDDRKGPITHSSFEAIMLAKLRSTPLITLENLPDVTEGLHHKIATASLHATNMEHFFTLLQSKRYPRTRLQRIVIHALLGTTKNDLAKHDATGPLYARILAFNDKGRELLRHYRGACPLLLKTTSLLSSKQRNSATLTAAQKMLALDTQATDLFTLAMPGHHWRYGGWDFLRSPVYVK